MNPRQVNLRTSDHEPDVLLGLETRSRRSERSRFGDQNLRYGVSVSYKLSWSRQLWSRVLFNYSTDNQQAKMFALKGRGGASKIPLPRAPNTLAPPLLETLHQSIQ